MKYLTLNGRPMTTLKKWAADLDPPMLHSNARHYRFKDAYQPGGPGTQIFVPVDTPDPRRWTHKKKDEKP